MIKPRSIFQLGLWMAAASAAVVSPAIAAAPSNSATVLLSRPEARALRSRAGEFRRLVGNCQKEIDYRAVPVETFAPDPHYTAAGVNTSGNNAKQLASDSRMAYRLGLCFLVTGEARYAASSQRILDAWSKTLRAVTTEQGKGDINFNLPYMIAAASWVRGANGWDHSAFDRFLLTTVLPNSTSSNPNNHGMWGVFMEGSAAAYLGDAGLLEKARTRWSAILRGAAAPDGTLTREIERSGTTNWRGGPDKGYKGIAYTHYFLLPASMAAKVFADQGRPIWRTSEGKLLQAAFSKAAGWSLHPETFPFYASNGGKLEGVRAAPYFPLLLRYYPNKDAEVVARSIEGEGGFLLPLLFKKR